MTDAGTTLLLWQLQAFVVGVIVGYFIGRKRSHTVERRSKC